MRCDDEGGSGRLKGPSIAFRRGQQPLVEMRGLSMRTGLRLPRAMLAIASLVPLAAGIWLVSALGSGRGRHSRKCVPWRSPVGWTRRRPAGRIISGFARRLAWAAGYGRARIARPLPEPEEALRRLERIRPDSPALAAWVQIDRGNAQYLLSRYDRSEASWNECSDSILRPGSGPPPDRPLHPPGAGDRGPRVSPCHRPRAIRASASSYS